MFKTIVRESAQRTLNFNNSLEGFTEFRKVTILIVTVYYSKRILTRITKGKICIGQSLGDNQVQVSSNPVSVESSRQHFLLPATMHGNMHEALPIRVLVEAGHLSTTDFICG